jgi:hypothetical protein
MINRRETFDEALDSRRFQPDAGLPVRSKNPITETSPMIVRMSCAESEARTQQSAELFLTAAARDNAWNFFTAASNCDRVISVLTPCGGITDDAVSEHS